MLFTPPPPPPNGSPPFLLSVHHDSAGEGHFQPSAAVGITSMLRTSGLLATLSAEELQTLLVLLSFVTPNGTFLATLPQLAETLHISPGKMAGRLARLVVVSWSGEPLVREHHRESGLRFYVPTPSLFQREERVAPLQQTPPRSFPVAGRDAVIAHSRAAYAHPRAEVEREIAERNGWTLWEDRASGDAAENVEVDGTTIHGRLLRLGFTEDTIADVLSNHSQEEIIQQLDWLPYRNARRPGSFLLAAIQNQYEEPPLLRRRRLQREAQEVPPVPENTTITSMREAEQPTLSDTDVDLVPLHEGVTLTLPSVEDTPNALPLTNSADP